MATDPINPVYSGPNLFVVVVDKDGYNGSWHVRRVWTSHPDATESEDFGGFDNQERARTVATVLNALASRAEPSTAAERATNPDF